MRTTMDQIQRMRFWMTKSNLGPTDQSLQFKVERGHDRDELLRRGESFDEDMIFTSKIVWQKAQAIDEAEEPTTPEDGSKLAIAIAWLEDAFRLDSERLVVELFRESEALATPINNSMLKLAKKRLSLESVKVGGSWVWRKPQRIGLEE